MSLGRDCVRENRARGTLFGISNDRSLGKSLFASGRKGGHGFPRGHRGSPSNSRLTKVGVLCVYCSIIHPGRPGSLDDCDGCGCKGQVCFGLFLALRLTSLAFRSFPFTTTELPMDRWMDGWRDGTMKGRAAEQETKRDAAALTTTK